eukprot:GFKZ01012646.1.p1 GENE.GFKZ01012646.1~~GFKZ01012646.1.p1  ORF type:complete len:251 (-),score=34.80 GFKZ01012646.1:41-793(-)
MVSADNTAVAPTPAPTVVAPKPPLSFCPKPGPPSLTLTNVTVNSVRANTLTDLLSLGKHIAVDNLDARPDYVKHAFPGDSRLDHDAAYFKALLAAQQELRVELRNKIKGLLAMRRRNNKLEKRKLKRCVAAFNASRAAMAHANRTNNHTDSEVTAMATKTKGQTDSIQNSFTGSGLNSMATAVTRASDDSAAAYGARAHVRETWHGVQDQFSLCSSPSTTGMPPIGKVCGQKKTCSEDSKVEEVEVSPRA